MHERTDQARDTRRGSANGLREAYGEAKRNRKLGGEERSVQDPAIAQLAAASVAASSAAWDRLAEIAKERTADR